MNELVCIGGYSTWVNIIVDNFFLFLTREILYSNSHYASRIWQDTMIMMSSRWCGWHNFNLVILFKSGVLKVCHSTPTKTEVLFHCVTTYFTVLVALTPMQVL